MRRIFSTLLLLLCVVGMNAQLLWRISGNGLAKPSYVIGTYHLAPASFVDSIHGLKDAMAATDQVYGEIVMSEMSNPANASKLQAALMLPDGKTLNNVLSAEQMERFATFMKEKMNVDLSNPMIASQMLQLSPKTLTMKLGLLLCMKDEELRINPMELFDGYFQQQAAASGKPVGGLETLDFQIGVLYDVPMERQVEELMCFVDNFEWQHEMLLKIKKAFFSQELDDIYAALNEKRGDNCDPTPEEEAALISDRNANWAKEMPALMKDKSTLFAVGSGHLPGERGLLQLLRQAGFTVKAVK